MAQLNAYPQAREAQHVERMAGDVLHQREPASLCLGLWRHGLPPRRIAPDHVAAPQRNIGRSPGDEALSDRQARPGDHRSKQRGKAQGEGKAALPTPTEGPVAKRTGQQPPAVRPHQRSCHYHEQRHQRSTAGRTGRGLNTPNGKDDARDIERVGQDIVVPLQQLQVDGKERAGQEPRPPAGEARAQVVEGQRSQRGSGHLDRAIRREVRPESRGVKVALGDGEALTSAHDRHAPLELVEGYIDPGAGQVGQRAFHSLARHQRLQVAQLTAGSAEQPPVRAGRPAIDIALDQREEASRARVQPAPDTLASRGSRGEPGPHSRCAGAHEARHIAAEARQHRHVFDGTYEPVQRDHAPAASQRWANTSRFPKRAVAHRVHQATQGESGVAEAWTPKTPSANTCQTRGYAVRPSPTLGV